MAGSGNKRVVHNTRERLLSLDHNREQAFEAADIATALARTFLPVYEDDRGVSTLDETKAAPLTALILDGLMLRPIDGSASALVDPGTVVMSDPDASPSDDDVPWKWVHSDGILAAGELVLTGNPGGTRIDVVEFSRTEEVFEYDSRDQFDPGTGLFTPVPLEKVRRGALVFRIRLGVVGSSFPGLVAGWVPIAVVRVPSVTNTWDDVTVWDVRPLLADRRAGGPNVGQATPRVTRQLLKSDLATIVSSVGATVRISGTLEGELRGWRVGGVLVRSVPGTMTSYLEATQTASQEGSGVTFDANKHWYLYLLFPYGLPAWRRYSDPGSGGRVPVGHRGIAVFSKKVPRFTGRPSETIYPPNSTDVQNGTYASEGEHPALCIASGRVDSTMLPLGLVIDGVVSRVVLDGSNSLSPSSQTVEQADFTLLAGTHFPDNARALHVRVFATVSAAAAIVATLTQNLLVTDATGLFAPYPNVQHLSSTIPFRLNNAESFDFFFSDRVVLEPKFDETSPRSFKIRWSYPSLPADLTLTNVTLTVIGWETGG